MKQPSLQRFFDSDNIDKIIMKMMLLLRIALIICISIFTIALTVALFSRSDFRDRVDIFIVFFAAFYSVIWVTVPSMFLLTAIIVDNKFRKKTRIQPVKTEIKLLYLNIILILATVAVVKLVKFEY